MAFDMKINQKSVIADVLRHYPDCIGVFERNGMPCRTCMGVSIDTVEEGALMHDVDLESLLTELRQCCGSN